MAKEDSVDTSQAQSPNSVAPDAKKEPIDIETLSVHIVMLVAEKRNFIQMGSYLGRRGWQVDVTSTLNELIQVLAVNKPDFILVSLNHPSPKVLQMPDLLAQTFGAQVVVFAERSDMKTVSVLNNLNCPLKIRGSISGPAIHRNIIQILQEMYNPTSQAKSSLEGQASDDNQILTFSGDQNGEKIKRFRETMQDESSTESSATVENLHFGPSAEEVAKNQNKIIWQKSNGGRRAAIVQQENKTSAAELGTTIQQGGDSLEHNKTEEASGALLKHNLVEQVSGTELKHNLVEESPGLTVKQSQSAQTVDSISQNEQTAQADAKPTLEEIIEKNPFNDKKPQRKRKAQIRNGTAIFNENIAEPTKDQKELYSSLKAIADKMKNPPKATTQPIRAMKEIYAFPIRAPSFSGFAFMAMSAADRTHQNTFIGVYVKELEAHFKEKSHSFEMGEGLLINTMIVDFYEWASRKTDFFFIQQHGQGEIAFGIVGCENPFITFEMDKILKKARVNPKQIVPDQELDFNAYIYLRKNKRFFRYLKSGKKFLKNQQERFLTRKEKLYINEGDVEIFRKAFITGFFNQLVEDYLDDLADIKKVS